MTIGKELTPKLQKLVLRVEDDLRARLEDDSERKARWQSEHVSALKADRTSSAWVAWRDDRITQSAVGWVLTTVFLRFCEDNALLSGVWISGPGKRRQEAFDAENAYFRANPENTWREWIIEGINHLGSFPATKGLVDEHAALWQVFPSGGMSKDILDFWRATDESGIPMFDFQDDELSTRFLGDLYQDLSEYAKKTFALLQTPEFVEEFILGQTLTPALAERPLDGFKLIDPTCGSGHFLLGGFQRLLDAWSVKAPNMETRERVQVALDAIYGVDLNPFAVAIARFRLTIAALQATGELDLEHAPDFRFHLAAGDSLLYGRADRAFEQQGFDLDATMSGFAYSIEDRELLEKILTENQYDVVVGNPPYITVKDKVLNERYRNLYKTCKGKYALSVPFMERFFRLAKFGSKTQTAGWTGQITSNSFMKREFGSKIIENYLRSQDLRLVVDTSGAYIPGHGTPTVIIVGKHQEPIGQTVRAVLGIQGEPGRPKEPANGKVWRAITDNIDNPQYEDEWLSIVDLPRKNLATHPWNLKGGGNTQLVNKIEANCAGRLDTRISGKIGFASFPGADDAFFSTRRELKRHGVDDSLIRAVVTGDVVRDWTISQGHDALVPYDAQHKLVALDTAAPWARRQWPLRTTLGATTGFGGQTQASSGQPWWGWYRWVPARYEIPMSITFAFVATHNHFVLERGGKVLNRSAPVIKLPDGATEDDHLALLGVLNSSTACFWLKQNSHNKGDSTDSAGARVTGDPAFDTYEFTGTILQSFPLPSIFPLDLARALDQRSGALDQTAPSSVIGREFPSAAGLHEAEKVWLGLREQMVMLQEEIDWETYRLYGLLNENLTYENEILTGIKPGERAFEIELARRIADGSSDSTWFSRHGLTPITELPAEWPEVYKDIVQRRIDAIENHPNMRLLEKPEFKRRWATETWDKQQSRALRGWLLDKLEDPTFWRDSQERSVVRSIAQLADIVSHDESLLGVLALWERTVDLDVEKVLTKLLSDVAVPYLAAQRLKESGLRKRESWEDTWDFQRREDIGEIVGKFPAPQKYVPADFRNASWWQARGKLDVAKERFILYQNAGRSTDPTLVLGWAGWDHVQQFLVLATLMDERIAEGVDDALLIPLVAGMAELLPWVRQWHSDIDPTFGMSMADFCAAQLEERMTQLNLSNDDLKGWRPTASTRGRRMLKENA